MKVKTFIISLMLLIPSGLNFPNNLPEKLNIKYMLRGYFFTGSIIKDSEAPGGYWASDNYAFKVKPTDNFLNDKFYLLVKNNPKALFAEKYRGMEVFLINTTGSTIELEAQDSRIDIVCQAVYNGEWKDIEYLPSSWCGNSYHKVFLRDNEYWKFTAPEYSGNIKTKLRFILFRGDESPIISNEFEGSINEEQLTLKQGYIPSDIMDPYLE